MKTLPRFARLNLALLLLGAAVAAVWLFATGGVSVLARLSGVRGALLAPLAAITAFSVLARFVRWQFLLRRAGVRLPARRSLSIYLASLAGIATPAYIGELLRSVFLRRGHGVPLRVTIPVIVFERLQDVAVLAAIGLAAAGGGWIREVMLAVLATAAAAGLALAAFGPALGLPAVVTRTVRTPSLLGQSLLLSAAAWLPASLSVWVAAAGLGAALAPVESARAFSSATLLGGLSLMPAGVGSAGSLAIFQLEGAGLSLRDSVAVVSLVRIMTTGLAVAIGAGFLVRELRRRHAAPAVHFDEIAAEYEDQFAEHVFSHLLERRIDLLADALAKPPDAAGLGLDLGCGLGRQGAEMARRGFRVVGIDPSQGLLRRAGALRGRVAAADGLRLPFADASFDFVYSIGVLHHVPGREPQEAVCREIARVLRPGGLCVVQETNPRNPLFRFYMGYVFPILHTIDEGTEWWIEPERWRDTPGLKLSGVTYFTFLPDFVPRVLWRPLRAIERRLEQSAARRYSAHYLAALRREGWAPADARAAGE